LKYDKIRKLVTETIAKLKESFGALLSHRVSAQVSASADKLSSLQGDVAYAKHFHPEYVKRDQPALFTSLLNGRPVARFALKEHTHPRFVKAQARVDGKVVIEQADFLDGWSATNFAPARHTHPYAQKTKMSDYTVASNASALWVNGIKMPPTVYYAPSKHNHDGQYLRIGQRAPRTRKLLVTGNPTQAKSVENFSVRYHDHPEYLSASSTAFKPKTKELSNAGKLNNFVAKIVRYFAGGVQPVEKEVTYYALNVIPKAWLPDDTLPDVAYDEFRDPYVERSYFQDCDKNYVAAAYTDTGFQRIISFLKQVFQALREKFFEAKGYVLHYDYLWTYDQPSISLYKYVSYSQSILYTKKLSSSEWHVTWMDMANYRLISQKLSRGELIADSTTLSAQNTVKLKFFPRFFDGNGVNKKGEQSEAISLLGLGKQDDGTYNYLIFPKEGRYWMPLLAPMRQTGSFADLLLAMIDTIIYYGLALILTIISLIYSLYLVIVEKLVLSVVEIARALASIAHNVANICVNTIFGTIAKIALPGMVANAAMTVYNMAVDITLALAVSKPITVKFSTLSPLAVPVIFKRVRWDKNYYRVGNGAASAFDLNWLVDPLTGQLRGVTVVAQGFQTTVGKTELNISNATYALVSPIGKLDSDFSSVEEMLQFLARYGAERHHPILLTGVTVTGSLDSSEMQQITDPRLSSTDIYVLRARVPFSGPEFGFGVSVQGNKIVVRNTGLNYSAIVFSQQSNS
jgi:hypothetical protein